jgi:hypothetical protein
MNAPRKTSMSPTREAHADGGSSDYEKRRESALDLDEEKVIGLDGAEYPPTEEQDNETPGTGRSQRRRSQDNKSLKTVRSHHSRAGGDGYTCLDADANVHGPDKSKPGVVLEQPYLVTWDGDADPENPRSMTMLRRWAIVLICAASSLCVYVAPSNLPSVHMHVLTIAQCRTCTSSLYTSTYSQLEPEFGVSRLVCTLGLSLFVAGLGAGPMILSPLSEVRTAAGNCRLAFGQAVN